MQKKKRFALLMCAAMACVALVGGTMAYLTYSDSDVNTMTVGNVKIEQHEYERVVDANGDYTTIDTDGTTSYQLKEFTQGKALLPATELNANGEPNNFGAGGWDGTVVKMTQVDSYGSMQVFTSKNAQDKFVTVENTGKTDAYVRTLVAFELGDIDAADFDKVIGISSRSTTDADNFNQPWLKNEVGVVEIDGNNYVLVEFIYHGAQLSDGSLRHANGVLSAGDTSYPSLCQVYMKSAATNEDVRALDGNFNGTYDILVLSQAVQAQGFNNAADALKAGFGEANETNIQKWFAGQGNPGAAYAEVADKAEAQSAIKNAIDNGDDLIIVNADNANIGDLYYGLTTSLVPEGTTVVIKNAGVTGKSYGNAVDGTVVFDNCTFTNTGAYSIHFDAGKGNVVFNNCVLKGWCSFGSAIKSVEMNNCTIQGNGTYAMVRFYQDTTMTDCNVDCSNATQSDVYVDGLSAVNGAVLTLKNCTLANCELEVAEGGKIVSDGIVIAA